MRPQGTSAEPGRDNYRWLALAAATFAQTAVCFLVQGLGALGGYLQAALGLDAAEVGLLFSAAQSTLIVGLLVAGELLDRFSERLVVGVGASMVVVSLLFASQAQSYGWLLFWMAVESVGYCTVQPGGSKMVAAWFPARQRGFAMGVRQAGLPLGAALASATLPLIAAWQGWRTAFVVGAAVAFAGGAAFVAAYRRPPAHAEDAIERPAIITGKSLAARLELLRLPAVRRIVWAGVTLVAAQYALSLYLPLDLRDRFGLPIETAVQLLFVAQGVGVIGRVALAAWSDRSRSGRYVPVAASLAAMILGLTALVFAPGAPLPVLALLAAWLGFFGFGWYGPWIAHVSETAPRGRIGFMIGLAMAINQVIVVASPPVVGLLRDRSGAYVAGWMLLIACLAVALARTRRPAP